MDILDIVFATTFIIGTVIGVFGLITAYTSKKEYSNAIMGTGSIIAFIIPLSPFILFGLTIFCLSRIFQFFINKFENR